MDRPIIIENNKGNGTLKWVQTSRAEKSAGSAILGRGVALYDFCMDHSTDLDRLAADLHFRMQAFRTVTIWTEHESNKVRKAWTGICYDHPGKGMDSVMSADVTLPLLRKWYNFQKESLETATILNDAVHQLWEGDFVQMAVDLCIPHKTLMLFRNWAMCPGEDVVRVTRFASDAIGGKEALKADSNILPDRDGFIMAWRYAEDKLLDAFPGKRGEIEL